MRIHTSLVAVASIVLLSSGAIAQEDNYAGSEPRHDGEAIPEAPPVFQR
jgi:hypothetical protein